MRDRSSSHASFGTASETRRKDRRGRLFATLGAFLLGAAVPITLGATAAEKPTPGVFGRIGVHRALPNTLVFEHRGEVLVLDYVKSPVPTRIAGVAVQGTIRAIPLREVIKHAADPGTLEQKSGELKRGQGARRQATGGTAAQRAPDLRR